MLRTFASDQPHEWISNRRVGVDRPRHREGWTAYGTVSLGQTTAVGRDRQGHVSKPRFRPAEPVVEQNLPGRAGDEISAANDLIHAHGGVVSHYGELIGWAHRVPADDEIAPNTRWFQLGAAEEQVIPADRARGHAESPGERAITQDSRIDRAAVCTVPG